MARWRQAVELGMTDEEIGTLAAIAAAKDSAARASLEAERKQLLRLADRPKGANGTEQLRQ